MRKIKKTKILSAILLTAVLIFSLVSCLKADVETPKESGQSSISAPLPESSSFEVHFIDVGQADAALVMCDGKNMLIDAGNTGDSSLMYTYLQNLGIEHLDYVVGTHAHEDHIGGMAGALNYATAGIVYCPVTSYESDAFENFMAYAEKSGGELIVPEVGDSFDLGSAKVDIIACNTGDDTNNTSIVLKIIYGDTSFLFTADAEKETEQALIDSGYDLSATVLKVGHHGSDTSTSYLFLREVMPQYAVISVGRSNEYGHPHEEPLSRLRDADVTVYRTDILGDIICKSDGKSVTFTTSPKGSQASQGGEGETEYVLNTSSMKFHYPYCSNAERISEKNKEDFYGTRSDLLSQGYSPGGCCDP